MFVMQIHYNTSLISTVFQVAVQYTRIYCPSSHPSLFASSNGIVSLCNTGLPVGYSLYQQNSWWSAKYRRQTQATVKRYGNQSVLQYAGSVPWRRFPHFALHTVFVQYATVT